MPVLRMPVDTTLGDTLGNLGANLTQAFNPLNQIRAQDMLAQMRQRQWEIQHQQQLDAANANAAEVYGNANPHGLAPADLEVAKAQIRNGNFNPSGTIEALKAAGGYAANQAAAGLIDTTHPEWSDGQRASAKADILSGRKSLAEVENDYANAALTTNKATATIGATNAATGATTGPQAALAAAAAASGDETGASKLIAQGNELTAPVISGPLGDADTQAKIDARRTQQAIAGTTPPAGAPVSSGLAAPTAVADITQKTLTTQAAPRAPTAIVPAVPPTDVLTGQPVTVAPGAAPPPGVISQAPQAPDIPAITQTKSAETAADAGTKFRADDVTSDMESGRKANDMLRTVALMRQYASLLDNDTPLHQLGMTFVNRVKDELGVTLDPNQSARNAFEQLGNQLIAETRKDDGVQRVAAPELNFFSRALPNAQQDRASLNTSLDQLEGKARRLIEIGRAARDVYGATGGNVDANSYTNYVAKREGIIAPPTANQPPGTPDTSGPLNAPPKKTAPGGVKIWKQNPDGTFTAHDASQ